MKKTAEEILIKLSGSKDKVSFEEWYGIDLSNTSYLVKAMHDFAAQEIADYTSQILQWINQHYFTPEGYDDCVVFTEDLERFINSLFPTPPAQ